jgi:hypothetical protein
VRRWDEAEKLINEVLEAVPQHPYANRLKTFIAANRL